MIHREQYIAYADGPRMNLASSNHRHDSHRLFCCRETEECGGP